MAWGGVARGGTGWRGVAWGAGGMGTRAAALAHQRACRHRVHVLPCARAGMCMACRWCVWRTAQRGSASMSSGRHASERKGVSSKALLRVGLGLRLGLGEQGNRVEGGTQGKGHLVHSGGSSDGPTEAEPRWRSSREGEPDPATFVGLEKPCVWAEGELAADLSFVGLGLGLRLLRCGEPARWGEPAFLLPGDGLRCFDEVDEGKRSAGDVPGPPGTSLRARTDGPAPTTSGTLSSTSTRR